MKRKLSLSVLLAASLISLSAQTQPDSFQNFRKQLFDDYQQFRKSIIEDYDRFLDATWGSFEQFKGETKYSKPKPVQAPTIESMPVPEPVLDPNDWPEQAIPAPVVADNIKPKPEPKPDKKPKTPKPATPTTPATPKLPKPAQPAPVPETKPAPEAKPVPEAKPKPEPKPAPETKPTPAAPSVPAKPSTTAPATKPAPTPAPIPAKPSAPDTQIRGFKFPYRGMELTVNDMPVKLRGRLSSTADFAEQWRELKAAKAENLVKGFEELAERHNLNDYLVYDVLKAYVQARYPDVHPTSQLSLVHFVLLHMGCDVRIALDEGGTPLILIPFNQKVYARNYLTLNGKQYYVFPLDSDDLSNTPKGFITTCILPTDRDLGRNVDLIINDLRLPEKTKTFDLSQGKLHITGSFNENIMPILYKYPQMATEDFATSVVSPAVRADIIKQLKSQLEGKNQLDAINALLRFTQSAFRYATDDEFHGFEKPYFFEEMLYYPKCDCEDRSIFYTYLLWNVLGVENHLINYPGHESASVRLSSPIGGDHYVHDGKMFFISDPTYIGARTGQCMPNFRRTAPGIDKEYK